MHAMFARLDFRILCIDRKAQDGLSSHEMLRDYGTSALTKPTEDHELETLNRPNQIG